MSLLYFLILCTAVWYTVSDFIAYRYFTIMKRKPLEGASDTKVRWIIGKGKYSYTQLTCDI